MASMRRAVAPVAGRGTAWRPRCVGDRSYLSLLLPRIAFRHVLARSSWYRSQSSAASTDADPSEGGTSARPGKRTVALTVGYNGAQFVCSQFDPKQETVEGTLLRALARVGVITSEHAMEPGKIQLARASRTDRGVSALGNVFTLRARVPAEWITPNRQIRPLVDAMNQTLPPSVRVFGAASVPRRVCAREHAASRVYRYFLPLTCLRRPGTDAQQDITDFQRLLNAYVGTHTYHNFTSPSERASMVQPLAAGADGDVHSLWKAMGMTANGQRLTPRSDGHNADAARLARAAPAVHKHLRAMLPVDWEQQPFHAFTRVVFNPADRSWDEYTTCDAWKLHATAHRTVYECSLSVFSDDADDVERAVLPLKSAFQPPPFGEAWAPPMAAVKAHRDTGVLCATAAPQYACVTLHASGFMYHQIRHMLGLALAIHANKLPKEYIRLALTLPLLHSLPRAPPFSLVQSEVHYTTAGFLTLQQPDGVPDDIAPLASESDRRAFADSVDVTDAVAVAAQAPDIALLTRPGVAERSAFFRRELWPALRAFCDGQGHTTEQVSCSSAEYAFSDWLASLDGVIAPPSLIASATQWHRKMQPSVDALRRRKADVSRAARERAAVRAWDREGKVPPLSMPQPVHLTGHGQRTAQPVDGGVGFGEVVDPQRIRMSRVPHGNVTPGALQKCRLAEVAKLLFPPGLSAELMVSCGLIRQRDVQDVCRAVAWRIMRAEWPAVASAEEHAKWVLATGPGLLIREGLFVAILERAEAREAVARMQYEKRAARRGEDADRASAQPLVPLEELYPDSSVTTHGHETLTATA